MINAILKPATLCMLLGACGELFGSVVEMPRNQAAMLIYNLPRQADVMGLVEYSPGISLRSMLTNEGVVWIASKNGEDACRFTAHVKADTEAASVIWTDIKTIGQSDQQFLCDTLHIAGEESVAAAIEGRPANETAVQAKLANAMVSNIGSVERSIFDDISKTFQSKEDDCSGLSTSADLAACQGDDSLRDPTDRNR